MKAKMCVIFLAAIMSLGMLLTQVAYAVPYVDIGFMSISPDIDGDLDLIIARENYDDLTYQQAIYFRAYDGISSDKAIGGTITFPGTIVAVYHNETYSNELTTGAGSDSIWGIAGADYSGVNRGLETFSGEPDIINILDPNTLYFDLFLRGGLDDFRVIIDYGDFFPDGSYMDIALNVEGTYLNTPYSTGIIVGANDGVVPGDGYYEGCEIVLTPPVPEPATMLLFGSGLVGLGLFGRKRFRK